MREPERAAREEAFRTALQRQQLRRQATPQLRIEREIMGGHKDFHPLRGCQQVHGQQILLVPIPMAERLRIVVGKQDVVDVNDNACRFFKTDRAALLASGPDKITPLRQSRVTLV